MPLPLITRVFFKAGTFFSSFGWGLLLALGLLILLTVVISRRFSGKGSVTRLAVRVPLIGPVYRMLFTIHFSYLLSVLLKKGVPLSGAITIVKNSLRNRYFKDELERMHQSLSGGAGLLTVLKDTTLFPVGFSSMISLGERGADLDDIFLETANFYRRELESGIDFWVKTIEPVIFLVVAFFVALIVFSILVPLLGFSFPA
jgi:type II secretory pathway component PulF